MWPIFTLSLIHIYFDRRLTAALQTGEEPDGELNAVLKARLYQKERELQSRPAARRVSLWWLPMTANLFVCGVPALIFALPIMPLAAHLAAFAPVSYTHLDVYKRQIRSCSAPW